MSAASGHNQANIINMTTGTRSKLIWINRFRDASNTWTAFRSQNATRKNDCTRVYLSAFHRPTFPLNPFKRFCLPFKSSFIDENTCFCGMCVYKRITWVRRGERTQRRPSNYARSNEAQKRTETDFRRVRFSARPSKIFRPSPTHKLRAREKIWAFSARLIDLIHMRVAAGEEWDEERNVELLHYNWINFRVSSDKIWSSLGRGFIRVSLPTHGKFRTSQCSTYDAANEFHRTWNFLKSSNPNDSCQKCSLYSRSDDSQFLIDRCYWVHKYLGQCEIRAPLTSQDACACASNFMNIFDIFHSVPPEK